MTKGGPDPSLAGMQAWLNSVPRHHNNTFYNPFHKHMKPNVKVVKLFFYKLRLKAAPDLTSLMVRNLLQISSLYVFMTSLYSLSLVPLLSFHVNSFLLPLSVV